MKQAHELSLNQLIKEYKTDISRGLTAQEAAKRLAQYGPNKLPEPRQDSWLLVFLRQFQNPLIYILLVAAAIIFIVGDHLDAFIISGVLFFNAIIGSVQEGRTRSILATLSRFMTTSSLVLRDGKKVLIDDKDLVPGDIILLQEGERVPADARIIESNGLQIDESILTGESQAVRKTTQDLPLETAILDQINIAFKGTYVLAGTGKAIVVCTGIETEIGKIHKGVETIDTQHMPLKDELNRLSHWILLFIIGICLFLLVIGLLTGKPFNDLLAMLTALFICVVPEGLPVVLTLILVTGVYRLARRNVLIKHMQAADALGRTQVIAIDKTGTLTRNELVVSKVFVEDAFFAVTGVGYYAQGNIFVYGQGQPLQNFDAQPQLMMLGTACSLLNRAEVTFITEQKLFRVKGDPTEAAMGVFADKLKIVAETLVSYKKLYEIPFDARTRCHAAAFERQNKHIVFVNGSPEMIEKRTTGFTEQQRSALNTMLDEGLRVVAVAYKQIPTSDVPINQTTLEELIAKDLIVLGFVGIQDSIRPEVRTMIEQARNAQLKVVMITGDHQKTALFVAKKVGIFVSGDEALDGSVLMQLSTEELMRRLYKTTVYSRITPENKIKIIKLYRNMGYTIAMTGDGINDAPSLVAADIGVAMGHIGTEVTKQAADMVLLDDSFASIMSAIEEGRHLFYTMRRVILYFFATNFGEILVVLFALVLNLPVPILPAQILWLNLVTDGFLDIALSMEPKEKGLMGEQRAIRRKHLVDKQLIWKMLYMALPMGIGSIFVFYLTYENNLALARSLTLVTMAMFQWFNAWNCRSESKSVFQLGLFSNRWLLLAFAVVLGLQVLVLNNSFMQGIFKTVPLSLEQWLVILGLSSSLFVVEELRKLIVRLRHR